METRTAGPADVEAIRWALYTALDWNPDETLPPVEYVLQHPEAERFHRDWGRPGDLGVLAEEGAELAGVAFCRLFTDDDHGEGYVDAATPEIAVAVRPESRGLGLGGRLLRELEQLAREHGFGQLSLSVAAGNPAQRLYERLGWRQVGEHDGDPVMLRELR
jgi:ribosomal protein S18 acetylase RimI-like enzyme